MSGRANREREQIRGTQRLEDWLSRAFGIDAPAIGMLLVVGGMGPSYAGPAGGMGSVFGALGHLLGVRWLGGAVVVASVAEIVSGLLA